MYDNNEIERQDDMNNTKIYEEAEIRSQKGMDAVLNYINECKKNNEPVNWDTYDKVYKEASQSEITDNDREKYKWNGETK